MTPSSLDRRQLLTQAMALGGSSLLLLDTPALAASPTVSERLNLLDPAARARTFAKIKGSCADEVVYTFCRLQDRKSTRLNSSHVSESRMPSSA